MKDFINYYYQFNITDLHLCHGKYFFLYNGNHYMFKVCEYANDIEEIFLLSEYINHDNKFYHHLVHNKNNSLITMIDHKPFVLLKLSNIMNASISLFDIKVNDFVPSRERFQRLNHFHWVLFWEKKVDYFEMQIMSRQADFYTILPMFHYFVGMAENAIQYLKTVLGNKRLDRLENLVVSHRRFTKNMTLVDFYDPTNLIIDHRARDITEFLKYSFFSTPYDLKTIHDYFEIISLSDFEAHLVFARLLFPTFYFDALEFSLRSGSFSELYVFESKIDDYQFFINEIYNYLSKKILIQPINWIIKKM
ncbi:MAG: hypothetical protein PUB18_02495 [bacterium]|nr:hypothetical protein [bacterium]